jgi:hypothetical protein
MEVRPHVELHIEELVLHGFAHVDRHAITAAVENKLAYLLTQGRLTSRLAAGGEVVQLDGGTFSMTQTASAESIGAHVAQAIYGGIASERTGAGAE